MDTPRHSEPDDPTSKSDFPPPARPALSAPSTSQMPALTDPPAPPPPSGLCGRLLDWVDDRTGLKTVVRTLLYEHIPGGARWKYIWGSMLVFVFGLQVITGILLMTVYQPSANNAWGSVYYIQYEMTLGWFIRGLHHFGSQAMIILLPIHVLQVVLAKAYKAPREFNWWTGLALMGCVLGLGLTGYLLPWDQKGYWATSVATNIMGTTPVLGPAIQKLVVGGSEYGHQTLTRFYTLHVAILPPAVVLLIVVHLALFRRHGVTVAERHARTGIEGNFWPDQAYKDMVACLFVFAALVGIVCYAQFSGNSLGSGLDAPADAAGDYPARPEWYFLFLFQLLKYFEGPIGTMVIPGAAAAFLFLLPLLDKGLPARLAHGIAVFGVVAGLGAISWLTYAALQYDKPPTEADYAANPDSANNRDKFQKQLKKAAEDREKFLALARNHGIPPEGPLLGFRRIEESLMHPGEKVFVAQCKMCHNFGKYVEGDNADLNDYGTAKWLAAFLKDPGHKRFLGEYYSTLDEKQRGMIRWRKQSGAKLSDAQLDAVAEVLLDIRSHPKLASTDFDPDRRGADLIPLVSAGSAARLGEAPLKQAASVLTRDCLKCHRIGAASGGAMAAPMLNGYAGREWVKQLIRDSHSDDFYGPRSKMPKFSREKIDDAQMEALLDFLLKPATPAPTAG